jgi:hypothetical protein
MSWTDPYARVLVISVPVRRPVDAVVMLHAHRAGLEGMVCTEAAGDQPKLEFQAAERSALKRAYGVLSLFLANEVQEKRQYGVPMDDGPGIAQHPPSGADKVSQPGREVVLGALLAMPEQLMAGVGCEPVAGKVVVSTGQAEQGFIWQPAW